MSDPGVVVASVVTTPWSGYRGLALTAAVLSRVGSATLVPGWHV